MRPTRSVWTPLRAGLPGLVGLLLAAAAAGARAQPAPPEDSPPPATEAAVPSAEVSFLPAAWPLGDWQLTPQLGLAVGHNSNLRMQATAPLSSAFLAGFPTLSLARSQGDERVQVSWRGEFTRFTASPLDNTANTELGGEGLSLLDSQTALAWRLAWQDWHDAVGQASPDQPADAPDHFRAVAGGAVWRHDAGAAAQHRVELEPTLSRRRYLNHRALTRRADVDTAGLVGRYLLQTGPAWRVGAELQAVRSHYPDGSDAQSQTDWRAQAVWQAEPLQAVHGSARVGLEHRSFDRQRPDDDRATWALDLHWQARPDTLFDWSATRAAADTPGEGADEAVARRQAWSWTQTWATGLRSTLTASLARNSYVNAPLPRDDQLRALDLAWRCDLGRRWQAGLNLGWLQRRSSVAEFGFSRRLASLSLTMAL